MKRKLIFVALAVALAASFSGYAKSAKKTKINFKTEKNGSLECVNPLPCDLVLFAGKIERNVVLGGIKGGETRLFDLSKISDMPQQGTFLMRAVPYEVYASEGRATVEDVVYTRLVVYDLKDAELIKIEIPHSIDISRKFGFYVSNDSPFVVEFHRDMPDGEIIAILPPLCNSLKVYGLPNDDRHGSTIFPVYIYAKNGVLYASGERRNRFRIQMSLMDNAAFCRIRNPQMEEMQDAEPIQLFGE